MTPKQRRKLITPKELDLREEPPAADPPRRQGGVDRLRVRPEVAREKRQVFPPSTG
jgi:hypothetical protein